MKNQQPTTNNQPLFRSLLWVGSMITIAMILGTCIMSVANGEVNSAVCSIAYDGNGSTKTFTFPFGILSTDQLRVVLRTVATGAETVLVLNSDYSMTDDDADGDYTDGPGGSITTLAGTAYSSAYEIWIGRKPALTQTRNIDGTLFLKVAALEDALDNLTYQVQYLRQLLYRVPMIPETEAQVSDMNLPAAGTAGYLYRQAGGGITQATTVDTGVTVTSYWQTRLETDTNAAEARTGLDAQIADPNLDDAIDRTFNHGLIVANGATSSGYLAIKEDSDNGSSYARILVPALPFNVDWTWPDLPADGYMKVSVTGAMSVDTPAGGGDMLAATYDADSNNIVNYAQEANSVMDYDFGDVNVVSGVWHVDDLIGAKASKSNNTAYLAATAGFVCAITANGWTAIAGYTDSSNPPTTTMARNYGNGGAQPVSVTFPVKKGHYWKVVGATTVYWIPLGQ